MAASCIGGRGHQGSVRKLAAKMIDAGKSYQDIADKLGVSRQRIGQIAKSLGVDRRAHGEFVRSGWFLKRQKEAAERRERAAAAQEAKRAAARGKRRALADQAARLRLKGLSAREIAREIGLPWPTYVSRLMTEFYPELKMQKQGRVAQKRWSAPGARPTERDTEIVRALLVAQSPVTEIAAQHRTSASNVYRIARKHSIERKRHVGHSPGNAAA